MKYFKISSEKEADTLSRTMYKMMYSSGANTQTTHLFDWLINEKGAVIIRLEETDCPVFKKSDYDTTISKVEEITGEATTKATKTSLDKGKVNPIDLLNGLEEVEYQYLLDNGFIKEPTFKP